MIERSYSEFSLGVTQRALGAGRVPLNGTLELTRRCPLECTHCYNNLPVGDRSAIAGELSYAELCRVMEEMAEAGTLWLLLTGGEILARPDFLEIYTYAKKKGFLITLFTNGTMITAEIADHWARYRPFAIEITLYGHTRETYERLTRVPGSFDRCRRGIELLLERKLPLRLKTVGVATTRHEILEMKRFAEELGLEFKFDSMINPRIDCSLSPLEERMTPQQIVEFDLDDPKRTEGWLRFAEAYNHPMHETTGQRDQLYHCGGGVNAFAIDPSGHLSICVLSHNDRYDLRRGSFREGWQEFLGKVRDRRTTRPTRCVECGLKAMCGMCPANGELENRDPEEPVDFLCHVAHLRAASLDIPVRPHGECPYCTSGVHHEALMQSSREIKSGIRDRQPRTRLQVVREAAGGGCTSCGGS